MKISKMTREEALWEALLLWRWVALTGKNKDAYPASTRWRAGCPLCEYDNDSIGCRVCPWPGIGGGRCTRSDSPFRIWQVEGTTETARRVADLMRSLLDQELGRLAQGRTAVAVERQRSRDASAQES